MTYHQPWAQGSLGIFWLPGAPDAGDGLPGYMMDPAFPGPLLKMELRIIDSQGNNAYGSTIEVWHADENGHYDPSGYTYRRLWHTAGIHAEIDVATALPGIVVYNGQPVYRHIHLQVEPPQPYRGAYNNIADWRGEIRLQLPPWTDPVPPLDDPREVVKLAGPYTAGFGGRTWYLLEATIVLDYP